MEVWTKTRARTGPKRPRRPSSTFWAIRLPGRASACRIRAEMIVVQTKSADPNGDNRPAAEVAATVKKVVDAVDVPVIVWGVANHEKDTEVMRQVAEICLGRRVALCPVEEGDYKQIGAACLGYKHVAVASSPIDVNLAKQLNILLGNLGSVRTTC